MKREIACVDIDWSNYAGIQMGEDLIQVLPMFDKAKKIVYLQETLHFYRLNDESITKKFNVKYFNDMIKVSEVFLKYVELWGAIEFRNIAMQSLLYGVEWGLVQFVEQGDFSQNNYKKNLEFLKNLTEEKHLLNVYFEVSNIHNSDILNNLIEKDFLKLIQIIKSRQLISQIYKCETNKSRKETLLALKSIKLRDFDILIMNYQEKSFKNKLLIKLIFSRKFIWILLFFELKKMKK